MIGASGSSEKKRVGLAVRNSKNYSHASHTNRVLRSSVVRLGGRLVLQCLCRRAEFDRPDVTITKGQIGKDTGLERKAIQRALSNLRDEGSIVPVKDFVGGRGNAVTYKLVDVGPKEETGADDGYLDMKKRRNKLMAENKGMTFAEATTIAKKQE